MAMIFGIINVKGNNNTFVSNSLSCEWAYADAVAVNATQGTGNVFKNCFIDNFRELSGILGERRN